MSQTASNPSDAIAVPFGLRHVREIDPAACVPAQLVEPHPRVDLVDEGVRDHRRRPMGLVPAVLPPSTTSSAQLLLGAAWVPMWFFLNLYLQQVLGLGVPVRGGAAPHDRQDHGPDGPRRPLG